MPSRSTGARSSTRRRTSARTGSPIACVTCPRIADATGPFELVVANILRGVLLAFADALSGVCARGGALVLSGLVSTDVPEVSASYAPRLGGARPEVYEREDWRALVWRSVGA
jgi:ribosomal protein L11 methylase PrmA